MITLLGGAERPPSLSQLTLILVLLQAVLSWHFVWNLYGIKDVKISTANMESGRNCIFFFMGCSYFMNQDVIMQWIFSGELSAHLTLSGLFSTIYIVITPGKNGENLTFLVQLPLALCDFIHCRELNEKWASLLWKCQLPLCTMYSLLADLCSPLKMFVGLFVCFKKDCNSKGKNESLCCEHTDAKKGWLWSWHLLQNKEEQNEGSYFSCSKIKGQQLEPFIPSEAKPG